MYTISSHGLFRYVLSVRPFCSTFATRGCCCAFGSSTMVDPFILRAAGWGSCQCPLSFMPSWSCTLVSARLSPLQLTTSKWSNTFIICRCCTQCTTGRQNSTSHHRSQLCWLLSTLLLFGWHLFRAFSSGDYRELRFKYSRHPLPMQSCHSFLILVVSRNLHLRSQCHLLPAHRPFH